MFGYTSEAILLCVEYHYIAILTIILIFHVNASLLPNMAFNLVIQNMLWVVVFQEFIMGMFQEVGAFRLLK